MTQAVSSPPKTSGAGLEGVVAAPSEICFIDGNAGRLVYRGYEIADLVENASFEEVAFLLWDEKLPNRAALAQLNKDLGASTALPAHALSILRALPKQTVPMDALRTAVSSLSSADPDLHSNDQEANRRKAVRLTAQFPTIVAAFHKLRAGQEPIAPDPTLTVAGNFLYMLSGKKAHDTITRVLDAALVLHAEHGFKSHDVRPGALNAGRFGAAVEIEQ